MRLRLSFSNKGMKLPFLPFWMPIRRLFSKRLSR